MANILTISRKRYLLTVTFAVVISKGLAWSVLFQPIFGQFRQVHSCFTGGFIFLPIFKSVIWEFVHAWRTYIELWMHAGSLESTQNA